MRYIALDDLIKKLLTETAGTKNNVKRAKSLAKVIQLAPGLRQAYIRRNGPRNWSPVKTWLVKKLGNKCWYTEVELTGAPLSIDHFRPVSSYWWLAFTAENYRVACAFANSPMHNPLYGCSGGKGDAFPLLAPGRRATWRAKGRHEKPVILDPCDKSDCELVAFQADGRPVISPVYASDTVASARLDESKILLNLDHPAFNAKREELCNDIAEDVNTYEALPAASTLRNAIKARLERRLSSLAPFSSAARHYLRFHRHLQWVEDLLAKAK
jgi:hypothetical protein